MLAFIMIAVLHAFLVFTILSLSVNSSIEPAVFAWIPLSLLSITMFAVALTFDISVWAIPFSYLLCLLVMLLRDIYGKRHGNGWISYGKYFGTAIIALFGSVPFGLSLILSLIYTVYSLNTGAGI